MTAATLMTVHNLFYYLDMMRAMRQSIRLCRFEEWRGETLRRLADRNRTGRSATVLVSPRRRPR